MGWCLGLIALGLLSAGTASAHPQFGPATINRYGRLVLTAPDRARLSYTLMVGDIPALRLRQSVDADHNGQLDRAEQASLQAELLAQVQRGLALQVGPHALPLTWEPTELSLTVPTVSAHAFAFDAVAVAHATQAVGTSPPWRYQDRLSIAPIGEVELRIDAAPGVWLRGSHGPTMTTPGSTHAGSPPTQPVQLFQSFGPPAEGSRFEVELDVASRDSAATRPSLAPTRSSSARLRWLAGLGLLLAVAAVAARLLTRRSR